MSDQLAALQWRADCLKERADSVEREIRADASSTQIYASEELELGNQGYGEVEFYVNATVELSLKSVKSVSWYDNDDKKVARGSAPTGAIEAALRKIIARNPKRFIDSMG